MLTDNCVAVLEPVSAENVVGNATERMGFEIPSRRELIIETIDDILNHVSRANLNMQFMRLVIEEALVNAMEHGNRFDHSKTVSIRVEVTSESLVIRIRDQGKGFEYNRVSDPHSEAALWNRRGRGIFLMRKIMDEVIYTRNGSEITLIKNL